MKSLAHITQIRVRFAETDPLGIVWHGNYIHYFEDGREAFGREYGISYLDQKAEGYTTPIVKSSTEHKLPLRYGDVVQIKTTLLYTPAAKIIFKYEVFNPEGKLACTGETIQVFVNQKGELSLNVPQFYIDWKKKVGLYEE